MPKFLPTILPQCPATGCGCPEFLTLISNLIQFLQAIAIPIAILIIAYGAVLLLTSAGNESRIGTGKEAIYAAVIGLFIVFGVNIIYSLVIGTLFGNTQTGLPSFICPKP